MECNVYLKPCPFCGREISKVSILTRNGDRIESMEGECEPCGFKFEFNETNRNIYRWDFYYDAVDIWNKRAKEESAMDKFVDFYTYCKACKYKDKPEYEDPCNGCLNEPVNEDSHKPWYFEEAENE